MKELSTEQKAKQYDEALEKIYQFIDGYSRREISKKELEGIFPELKEPKDENIRKWLISYFKDVCDNVSEKEKKSVLAWIEKQAESVDKVKPKFRDGDWCIDNEDGTKLWSIKDAKDGDVLCTYECCEPKIVFILKGTPKKHYALSYHCYYNIMYPHFESDSEKGCLAPNDEDVKPATKGQRDLLFSKMKEAGYVWDTEDKQLKKIEQKHTPKHKVGDTIYYNSFGELKSMIVANVITGGTDNPMYEDENGNAVFEKDIVELKTAWSEEDETKRNALISLVEEIKNQPLKRLEDWDGYISWLKSLRPRSQWKPSEEQMKALDIAIRWGIQLGTWEEEALESLIEQLEQLMKLSDGAL